eukprot:TRINITY_DN11821_c0_g1_i1.p1 TRINITY_DN11821_c0_g1~~TRINITY_DN11821_c0_g1_i1.p1  ORF type:complete len:195 (+),score=73.21 TRINITY_DN11821_c0_g1_i1:51-635(+)
MTDGAGVVANDHVSVEMRAVRSPAREEPTAECADSDSDSQADPNAHLPPFSWADALCWALPGLVCTLGGWVFCFMDRSECNWWFGVAVVPPLFVVCGVAFQYWVVDRRFHPVLCCCTPKHWKRTGCKIIALQAAALALAIYEAVVEAVHHQCTTTPFEWLFVMLMTSTLFLSFMKDIAAVAGPPPAQHVHQPLA